MPAPKERGLKQTVKKPISRTLFEFKALISIRSGHCTGTCRCREAQGLCESGLVRNPGYEMRMESVSR